MTMSDETVQLIDDLEAYLVSAMPHAQFDGRGYSSVSAATLATLFHTGSSSDYTSASFARPTLDDLYLNPIVACLAEALAPYIQTDKQLLGNGLALIMGGQAVLSIADFAKILIRASAILGPTQAIHMLRSWVGGEPIRYTQRGMLVGLSPNHPTVSLADTITIHPLPMSRHDLLQDLSPTAMSHVNSPQPVGRMALSIGHDVKPAFFNPNQNGMPEPQITLADHQLAKLSSAYLREALSLACDAPIDFEAVWYDYGDLFAFSSGGISSMTRMRTTFWNGEANIGPEQWSHAVDILRDRSRAGSAKSRLDLAIQRWWASKGGQNLADNLIDLRIALERLYLPQDRGELAFRLAARGAWHVGRDYDERKEHWQTLREVYALASTAVHTGEVKDTLENRGLLVRGQRLCRAGILRRLNDAAEPDWDALILGKPSTDAGATV